MVSMSDFYSRKVKQWDFIFTIKQSQLLGSDRIKYLFLLKMYTSKISGQIKVSNDQG